MTPLLAQRPRLDRGFERLYKRHVGDVYRYALAVMRNPTDAEDVTQTTFLNAYRAYVEKGSRPDKPQNWLIAIAHNVCRQRFRQTARRPSEVSFEDDIADTVADDDAPSAEDIRRALGHLAFNQRAAPGHARARRPLLRRDRRDPRGLYERGGDADLPRPSRAARAARGVAHVRRGRVRDLTPARWTSSAGRARPAARAPARMFGMRRLRSPAARTTRRPEDPGARAGAELADVAVRRRRRRRGWNRSDAEGSGRADRRPGDRRSKLRRCAPRTVAGREADGGCGAERVSAELQRRAMPLSRREERHASRPAAGLVVTRPRRRASNRRRPRRTAAHTSRHWHERTRASLPMAGVRSSPAEPAWPAAPVCARRRGSSRSI